MEKEAEEKREAFMEGLAAEYEKRKQGTKAKKLKQLIETERNRDMYKKLRVITKKLSNLGTLYVTVKDSNGEKKEISNRKEMEKAIT